jgi:tetratricopeptide (TPR) repeat protein
VKRFSFITTLFLSFGLLSTAQAAGPDDSFIQAYTLIAQADNLARLGQKNTAIQKYRQARNDLAALQSGYPDWNAAVVSFRIKYVDRKLKAIGAETPGDAAPLAKPAALDPAAARREIAILKRKVESLENAIILKDAKLKEALSAVPSPEETKQLATLESDLSGLRQENDNLKNAIDKATAQLKDANTDLAKAKAETEKTNKALAQALEEAKTAKAKANDRQAKRLEKQLADKQESLEKTEKELASLTTTRKALEGELKSFKKGNREKDLEAKVGSLEKQLAKSDSKLKETASSLATAESSNDSLEDQLKAAKKGSREKEMLNYISSLEKRLAKAERKNTNPASKRKGLTGIFNWKKSGRAEKAKVAELQNRLDTLRSRLEILEAEKIPYTDDEKKLFAEPQTTEQHANTLQAKVATLPEGGADDFKAGQAALIEAKYGEAEQKFLHVLKLDEENPLTLSNLAIAQMEQGNYDDAEASLTRALKNDDKDASALSLIGTLRYRQKKYDEARDYLAKAVKLNPEDANAQHFLGSALNNLGQRKAAETALRKAVQIKPGHAEAHHNLAVVYATQKPPFTALAKFHYEKALAAGHKKNADLEKILTAEK